MAAKTESKRKLSIRVLAQLGRDLPVPEDWAEDHSEPAKHRDREAEFHAKIEEEVRELEKGQSWLQAA